MINSMNYIIQNNQQNRHRDLMRRRINQHLLNNNTILQSFRSNLIRNNINTERELHRDNGMEEISETFNHEYFQDNLIDYVDSDDESVVLPPERLSFYSNILRTTFYDGELHLEGNEYNNVLEQSFAQYTPEEYKPSESEKTKIRLNSLVKKYSNNESYLNDRCPILYQSFETNDDIVQLKCCHIIDSSQFETYINHFSTCPLCKSKLY